MNENGAGLSAVAAIATAVIAVWTLRDARVDSRERSRPMVLAEFRRAKHSNGTIDLIVRNAGPSIARDVKVTFDPVPVVPDTGGPYVTPYLLRRYAEPIPALAPGQELTNIWFAGRAPNDGRHDLVNGEPTPDAVTVTIEYRGTGRRRRYVDEFPLHVDLIRMMTYSTSSTSLPGRMRSIDESLRSMKDSAKRLAGAVESRLPVDD